MSKYSIFNDPKAYRENTDVYYEIPVVTQPVFSVKENEYIEHTFVGRNELSVEDLGSRMDETDMMIIEEIARSKYLTSLQVYEFVSLRGGDVNRNFLRKRLNKLVRFRFVQENTIKMQGAIKGVRYYELDFKGYHCALSHGVQFNKGNAYFSFAMKIERNIEDTPMDVKRVLVGNQIILGLLMCRADIDRFGIMETFRIDTDLPEEDGRIFRTAATVRISRKSVLAYEVVRDSPEAYNKLVDKIDRYLKTRDSMAYIENNHHGDAACPQFIICGESLEHNRKLSAYLKKEGFGNIDEDILYTDDLLAINEPLLSIYRLEENGVISRYRLSEVECDRSDKRISA